jgi:hypothetical protein
MDPATAAPQAGPADAAGTVDSRDRTVALGCALLLLIGMPVGYLSGDAEVVGLIITVVVSLAIMAGLVLRLVPHERAAGRTDRTALILGIVAVVVGVVFWTGLPFAVGAGAIALGLSGTDGRAKAGLGLGLLAVVASFVLLLVG